MLKPHSSHFRIITVIWAATWQNQQNECAPSEDSDQSGHPPSLSRVFALRLKKAWVLSYPLNASKDSVLTGRMPRLIWVFAGHTLILLVLSCRSSFLVCPIFFWFYCRIKESFVPVCCGHKNLSRRSLFGNIRLAKWSGSLFNLHQNS